VAAPVYNGGASWRSEGYVNRSWGQSPEPTGSGWLGRFGSWLGGGTPSYAGQPAGVTVVCGPPVYLPAPPPPPPGDGCAGGVNVTPQANPTVRVGPQR
jgi:hypothetical protein